MNNYIKVDQICFHIFELQIFDIRNSLTLIHYLQIACQLVDFHIKYLYNMNKFSREDTVAVYKNLIFSVL